MKLHNFCMPALVAAAWALAGCASAPERDVGKPSAEVKVYRGSELSPNQYQLVSHVWANSWRTAWRIPTYPDEEAAIASLRDEAGRLGANGLINVVCLNQGTSMWTQSADPGIVCYASAIRVP
jgi:uncharacterized protein YbjQ (UPF0145 family)